MDNATFNTPLNTVPAPPGAVLGAIGVFGLVGFRALRRRTAPVPVVA